MASPRWNQGIASPTAYRVFKWKVKRRRLLIRIMSKTGFEVELFQGRLVQNFTFSAILKWKSGAQMGHDRPLPFIPIQNTKYLSFSLSSSFIAIYWPLWTTCVRLDLWDLKYPTWMTYPEIALGSLGAGENCLVHPFHLIERRRPKLWRDRLAEMFLRRIVPMKLVQSTVP